jgi:hypothetical protein
VFGQTYWGSPFHTPRHKPSPHCAMNLPHPHYGRIQLRRGRHSYDARRTLLGGVFCCWVGCYSILAITALNPVQTIGNGCNASDRLLQTLPNGLVQDQNFCMLSSDYQLYVMAHSLDVRFLSSGTSLSHFQDINFLLRSRALDVAHSGFTCAAIWEYLIVYYGNVADSDLIPL